MSGNLRRAKLALIFTLMAAVGMISSGEHYAEAERDYRFPMHGAEFLLSGTFGELRSNHFHSGIDIKTGGETGKPLYAVRDGYVYRIKVSPYGFGKGIYLRHADGQFSVYGHMDGFSEEVEAFVYQKQYASKQYEQEIYLPEHQMPVKKGQLIGYSGNSGASNGPHLHFEIRDPDERITNPLQYYRHLVSDHVKPILKSVAFEPLTIESRVSGQFEKREYNVSGSNGDYSIPELITICGKVGLEYDAYDLLDKAANQCGINYQRLYLDGQLIFEFVLDRFSFDEKKFINVHFDYPYYKKTGKKYQRSYLDNGNQFGCYPTAINGGVLELPDDKVHDIRLELADGYHNASVLRAKVQRGSPAKFPESLPGGAKAELRGFTKRNIFVARLSRPSTAHLRGLEVRYSGGTVETLLPACIQGGELVYLLSLNKWRQPESLVDPVSGSRIDFKLKLTVMPDKDNVVEEGELQAYFPFACVFDTLPLLVSRYRGASNMYSDIYEIGTKSDPLLKSIVLNFTPSRPGNPAHLVVAEKNGNGHWEYAGSEKRENGSIYASVGNFGTFCVMADSIGPRIKQLNFENGSTIAGSQATLRLQVTDNFSGINSQKILCTIDGRWELFEFDAKTSTISHRLRSRPGGERHVLQVMVYDNAGNLSEAAFTLFY